MRYAAWLVCCLVIVPTSTALADGKQAAAAADAVDDLVKSAMDRQRIPGLSIAIVRDGKALKVDTHASRATAFSSAGLPEDPGPPDFQGD